MILSLKVGILTLAFEEKITKLYTKMASASRTVVDHTKSDSKFEGSNPVGTCREIMEKIYHNFARIGSTVVEQFTNDH